MRNLVREITALSNDANGVFEDQTTAGAAALVLNGALVSGGVATFAQAQKISIEGAGDNSGVVATISGTDADGIPVSEDLTLANAGTVASALYYKTITSITVDGAVTGNIEGGPLAANGAVSKTLRVNGSQPDFNIGVFVDVTGTLTYSAQYAYEQPEDQYAISYSASAQWIAPTAVSAQTADAQTSIAFKVNAMRLLISAYTSGSVKLTVTQSY